MEIGRLFVHYAPRARTKPRRARAFGGEGGVGTRAIPTPLNPLRYLIAPQIRRFFFSRSRLTDRLPSPSTQQARNFAPNGSFHREAYNSAKMKLSNPDSVSVYTVAGGAGRALPDWLSRRRKRSLKDDPEYQNRVELLQDFHFESASVRVRVSEDGNWVMSTGTYVFPWNSSDATC